MSEPPPPIPPAHLDYRSPDALRGEQLSAVPSLIASLAVYLFVVCLMCLVLPPLEQVFKDFKTELPGITKLILAFGRWFRELGWLVILPIPIACPFVLAQFRRHNPPSRRDRIWRIINVTIFALLVIGVVFALGALLPMVSLIQSVSSPTSK